MTDALAVLRDLTEACEEYEADKINWEEVQEFIARARRYLNAT